MSKTVVSKKKTTRMEQHGDSIHFSVAQVVNMGNYESLRVEYGETHTCKDGMHKTYRDEVIQEVMDYHMELVEELKDIYDE